MTFPRAPAHDRRLSCPPSRRWPWWASRRCFMRSGKSLHYFNLTKLAEQKVRGLENYWTVLTDPVFWQAMGRTWGCCSSSPFRSSLRLAC